MATYTTTNLQAGSPQTMTGSFMTIMSITAATATLTTAAITEFSISSPTAPADTVFVWEAYRCSSVGTGGSAATPSPVNSSNRAAGTVSTVNQTGVATVGVLLWDMALNQRASFRWVAVPGSEFIVPATNVNGVAWQAKNSSGGVVTISAGFIE